MKDDLISRQAAIDACKHAWAKGLEPSQYIEIIPPAQPMRPKRKWNTYYHGDIDFSYSCNQCGHSAPYGMYGGEYSQKKWAFCPNCGADMREVTE